VLLTLKLNVHFAKSFSRDRGSEIGNRESHRTLGLDQNQVNDGK